MTILLDAGRSAGISISPGALADGSGGYTTGMFHRAINGILCDFARKTKTTRQITSVALNLNSSLVSFSGIGGFDPERLIESKLLIQDTDPSVIGQATPVISTDGMGTILSVTVNNTGNGAYATTPTLTINDSTGTGAVLVAVMTGKKITSITVSSPGSGYSSSTEICANGVSITQFYQPCDVQGGLTVTDLEGILKEKVRCGSRQGTPRKITFNVISNGATTGGTIAPLPKATGLIPVVWSPPFVTWFGGSFVPDGSASSSLTHDIKSDFAETCVRTGGVVWLQSGEIQNQPMTNPKAAEYAAHVAACKGAGNLGVTSLQRDSSRSYWRSGSRWER